MDWFLYGNGPRHKRVKDLGKSSKCSNLHVFTRFTLLGFKKLSSKIKKLIFQGLASPPSFISWQPFLFEIFSDICLVVVCCPVCDRHKF